jgi:2-polyprenyl-3-methyl-5-hydroxy-6-metoxy-1,4-benzoquinol methylase
MDRIPEPELMESAEQARAYAEADFSESNSLFIQLFQKHFPALKPHHILDLGCGPADICIRLAETYLDAGVTGVDGAESMLAFARDAVGKSPARKRIHLVCNHIQQINADKYDVIVSNSLLHHLADPDDLWRAVRRLAMPGASILVMDLMRPSSEAGVESIVATYASGEPEVLRRDFYNSLRAAFTESEVSEQLRANDLAQLSVETVSDRHLLVWGQLENPDEF